MQGPIEKTLRWVVIIGVFLLPFIPLIVANTMFFPYITGKNFAFRIIVEVIGFAWLALSFLDQKYRPRRSWILYAFAAFVAIMAIADAQGVMPFKSFWSNFERMDGWITIAHTLVYLVVAASVLTTERLWKWLFWLTLGISVFIDLYGFAQIAGVFALGQGGGTGWMARIDATFGNAIYLAGYMLFHVFIAALLWYQLWQEKDASRAKRAWLSIAYGTVIVLDTIALLFTGTRGTTIGLVGGAVLAFLIYAIHRAKQGVMRPLVISVSTIVVIGVVTLGLMAAKNTPFVKSVGFLDRIASISVNDDTAMARMINWQIAWQGIKERPLLGWGQENYAIVFDKYYDARMYAQEQWFDRVHNIVFDWWVAGGTIGLLAYLSIFAAALWVLWRSKGFTIGEQAILTGLLAGYFAHLFFVFDNITSYILFATILAYIVWRAGAAAEVAAVPWLSLPRRSAPVIAPAAAILAAGVAFWVNGPALAQNTAIISGLEQQSGGLAQNLDNFKTAISYGAYGTQEAREQLVQVATQLAGTSVSTTTKAEFLTYAAQQMEAQAAASPLDARFPLFEGVLFDSYGQYDQAQTFLEKAHQLSPDKQSILYELGINAKARGDNAGALADFKQAFELDENNLDARIYYAALAIEERQDALADQILAPIIPTGQAADSRIAAALVNRGEYAKMAEIWKAHLAVQPNDLQAYFTLAAAYYSSGDKADAVAAVQAAEARDPSIKTQAETLITEIQNGTAKIQ